MFGKKPLLNPVKMRKQLLISESEINRVHLVRGCAALSAGVRALTNRVTSSSSIASSAASLVAGLLAWRRGKAGGAVVQSSKWRTLFQGAGLVSTVWLALRSHNHDQENKPPRARA